MINRIRTATILKKLEIKTDAPFTIYTFFVLIAELIPFVLGVIWQNHSIATIDFILDWLKRIFNPEKIINNSNTIISVETAYMSAAIAGTVFFYTVMDSGRIGIPYRKIMNYKYGTFSVSASIALSVVSLFVSVIGFLTGNYYIWCGAGVTMVLLQSSVLWRVLRSTSYRTSVKTITKQEKKQLIFLAENRKELEQFKISYELYIDSFMGRVASSEAVTTDRTLALRKLLDVPYDTYEYVKVMSMEKFFQKYYNDFCEIFVRIVSNEEQTDLVYGLLFEMVSDKEKNNRRIAFWPMITAAWYAAFVTKPIRYEALWTECINHMPNEYQQDALTVFMLMCVFWDRYENTDKPIPIIELCGCIICSTKWQYDKELESLLTILWNCWLKMANGLEADLQTDRSSDPFGVLEEILSEMRGEAVCTSNTIRTFMEWFNEWGEKNDN